MKHFFITMISVAFLAISGCNIYFNDKIEEIKKEQIELVTDSISSYYVDKMEALKHYVTADYLLKTNKTGSDPEFMILIGAFEDNFNKLELCKEK